jgi:CBS domain-containing protein
VVLDGPEIVGIVSDRDRVRILASGTNPDEVGVGEVISANPGNSTPADDVDSTLATMLAAGIRNLRVVEEGELVGIGSMCGLAAEELELANLGRMVG